LHTAIITLQALKVGRSEIRDYVVDLGVEQTALRRMVGIFHGLAWKARRNILTYCEGTDWISSPELQTSPVPRIDELIESLTGRIQELNSVTNEEARTQFQSEYNELLA